jgi:DNA repair exonuclease SbcCD ATPase subunit
MLIASLKMKNFRNFREASFGFANHNEITGENGEGKSTIMEAITFALYGVTRTGSPRCDNLIRLGESKAEVEVAVLVNGETHVISRARTVRRTDIKLDGKTVNQEAVESLLGVDAQTFLSAFSPAYLLGLAESEPAKARQFVAGLVDPPGLEEVLAVLSPEQQAVLENVELDAPEETLAKTRQRAKAVKEEKLSAEGKAQELRRQLAESAEAEVETLAAEKVAAQEKAEEIRKRLNGLELPPRPAPPALKDETVLAGRYVRLMDEYERLREKASALAQKEPKPGQQCSYCGQTLPEKFYRNALSRWQAEMQELADQARRVVTESKECRQKIDQVKRENARAQEEHRKAVAGWEALTAGVRAEKDKLDLELKKLNDEILNLELKIQAAERRVKISDRLKNIEAELAALDEEAAHCEKLIDALIAYQLARTELTAKKVTDHLGRVSLELFETIKTTGEVKPVFRLLYDGKPTPLLSFSERILAGLELCRLVRRAKGLAGFPVFVDNAESITSIDAVLIEGCQVFVARVEKGRKLAVQRFAVLPKAS